MSSRVNLEAILFVTPATLHAQLTCLLKYHYQNYITGITACRPQITTALGIGEAEYTQIVEAVVKEITNPTEFLPYLTYCIRFGRKALHN